MNSEATSEELGTKGRSSDIGPPDWLTVAVGAIMLINLQAGCGFSSGPVRIPVTGKVNLDDAPLLSGIIRFVPADNAGGPAAATKIVAGEFEFSSDNGPVVANHRVEIEATDFQSFAIDDEAAFAAAAEATGESPVSVNPVPPIYNSRSTLTASVTDADGQSFTFDLKKTINSPLNQRRSIDETNNYHCHALGGSLRKFSISRSLRVGSAGWREGSTALQRVC